MEPGNCTLVHGDNGSGKTSVLEGLAVCTLGRSFLAAKNSDLILYGTPGLSAHATLSGSGAVTTTIKVRKTASSTSIEQDGQSVSAASILARQFPLVVINSKVGDLLSEGPSNRRALLDRTLFHVEQQYVGAWKSFRTALRQRNQILRNDGSRSEAEYWETMMVQAANYVDERRQAIVADMNHALSQCLLTERFGQIRLAYLPGWKKDLSLAAQLAQHWERDKEQGFTTAGIHRADIRLRNEDGLLAKKLSRGQAKYLVATMMLSLAGFIKLSSGNVPVILVDDLPAELDDKMRAALVDIIESNDGQRVYTATKAALLPEIADIADVTFHVEH